jgi:hypothetical protein
MIFCHNCGSEINEIELYCNDCNLSFILEYKKDDHFFSQIKIKKIIEEKYNFLKNEDKELLYNISLDNDIIISYKKENILETLIIYYLFLKKNILLEKNIFNIGIKTKKIVLKIIQAISYNTFLSTDEISNIVISPKSYLHFYSIDDKKKLIFNNICEILSYVNLINKFNKIELVEIIINCIEKRKYKRKKHLMNLINILIQKNITIEDISDFYKITIV